MDQPKFERMLRLMKYMTGNTNLTVEDLASKLDTTYRSIYRYIDTFKDAGFVVQKMGAGVYQLVSVNRRVPDLNKIVYFSEEEASVINQLIDGLDNGNTMKQNLRQKLASVYESAPLTDFVDKKPTAQNIRDLSDAIRDQRRVILKGYKSSHSGLTTDREIEPFGFTNNYIHIWAFDLKDCKNKMFGVARIGEVEILDDEWTHKKEHKREDIDLFRMPGEKNIKVKLQLGLKAKNLLVEEYPLAEKEIRKSGHKWILETSVCSMLGIGRFVIGLADDIKIVDSPELVEYVNHFAAKHIPSLTKNIQHDKVK
ncbi:MAG: WYL domain-containing protein [Bacteroidales bacterium]|nr:WYL domain-containing protein [Candidatus Cacconaster scatequi]